jgi:long-subunit fatty acid transport protein
MLRPALQPRCASGGTNEAQKACAELALPQSVTVGGRYKFFGANGREAGDLEVNIGWENWGAERVTDYRVVVDSDVYVVDANQNETFAIELKDNFVRHGFKDTFSARLGGSYHIPLNSNEIIVRGGVGFDTAAAKEGWIRADIDGLARTTVTAGAGYKTKRWQLNVGAGVILEGTGNNPGTCNPTGPLGGPNATLGCGANGEEEPIADREGPDPITPVLTTENQAQNPVNQGTFDSHYVLLMLGFSTWF